MASNFVDDIEATVKTASYADVFNLNQDDPGYFEIGQILWWSWMTSITTQDSAWTSDVSSICSIGSNWSCVTQQNRTADFCQFNSWLRFYASAWFLYVEARTFVFLPWIRDKYKWLISNDEGVSNVNSMVSITPNVNTSHVDAINQ